MTLESAAVKVSKPTHDELRDRFIEQNEPHAYGQGESRVYRDGVYHKTEEDIVMKRLSTVLEGAKEEGIQPTYAMIKSVTGMCRIKLSVPDAEWDADPDLLVCENGVLRISTGELHRHSSDHYATTAVPYPYDPKAEARTWRGFIKDLFEEDVAAFLQEFCGYALTTETGHEIAVWLHSPPGGGKSTFLAGMKAMLGNRAGELGLRELSRSKFALATLPGKTLVTATEQPAGFVQITDLLNKIISGDPLQMEQKYHNPVDITPRCKIMWAMNDLPRVSEANNGIFRRVKVVNMPAIREDRRDPQVRLKIEREGAGILNWSLEGLDRLRKRGGFKMPKSVQEATTAFKRDNDIPALFVDECCELSPHWHTQTTLLYDEYSRWCKANGHKPKSETAIAADWKRLGLTRDRTNQDGRIWRGVKVPKGLS